MCLKRVSAHASTVYSQAVHSVLPSSPQSCATSEPWSSYRKLNTRLGGKPLSGAENNCRSLSNFFFRQVHGYTFCPGYYSSIFIIIEVHCLLGRRQMSDHTPLLETVYFPACCNNTLIYVYFVYCSWEQEAICMCLSVVVLWNQVFFLF